MGRAYYDRYVIKCGGRYLEDRADRTSWTDDPKRAAEYETAESAQADADALKQGVQVAPTVEIDRRYL